MEIYVVRHGQTITNTMHKVNGQRTTKLTTLGKIQAKQTGRKLKDITFDLVLSSPLPRAQETTKLITKQEIIIEPKLIERSYGDCEGKTKREFNYDSYWDYHKNLSTNNVESVKDLLNRITELLNELKEKHPDKKILIVTHSGIARAIHYAVKGIPENGDLTTLRIPNCTVRKYKI